MVPPQQLFFTSEPEVYADWKTVLICFSTYEQFIWKINTLTISRNTEITVLTSRVFFLFRLKVFHMFCLMVVLKDRLPLCVDGTTSSTQTSVCLVSLSSFSSPRPFVGFGLILGNLWEGWLITPPLPVHLEPNTNHAQGPDKDKMPSRSWPRWTGACGLAGRLESGCLLPAPPWPGDLLESKWGL